jgi:ferredoxin
MPLPARLAPLLSLQPARYALALGCTAIRSHCDSTPLPGALAVGVVFVDKKGVERPVSGLEGDSLVAVAHKHGIDLEGACACSLACSTCHVILSAPTYNGLEAAGEEEEDLLDLAFGLTPT